MDRSTFLTGATGYIGSYLAAGLLREGGTVHALVRARDDDEARRRLWRSLQLHLDFAVFQEHLESGRLVPLVGDLTAPLLGLEASELDRLAGDVDGVLHCAASLNRRSETSCAKTNLLGTLATIRFARAAHAAGGLRRFSFLSTVAVAGERRHETVREDDAIDWDRRDYDPYGRTKKFAEHMVRELLPDVPFTIFRPSAVLGDSTRPETTQFDMVRAFSFLAGLRVLPLRPYDRIDVVPVNWVADVVLRVHGSADPPHDVFHLSSGRESETYRAITDRLSRELGSRSPAYAPGLASPFRGITRALSHWGLGDLRKGAALLDVFLPYLEYDTVFENSRALSVAGVAPAPLTSWCAPLLRWAREKAFRYPYRPWPAGAETRVRRARVSEPTTTGSAAS